MSDFSEPEATGSPGSEEGTASRSVKEPSGNRSAKALALPVKAAASKLFQLRSPYLILAAVVAPVLLAGVLLGLSQTLTAALRGDGPKRIAGIESQSADGKRNAYRIDLGLPTQQAGSTAAAELSESRTAMLELAGADGVSEERLSAGARQNGYIPSPKFAAGVSTGTIITVPVSQGRLLRFDDTVESVFIADPEIADIRMVSSDLVYIFGKTLGLTNLMAVSNSGEQGGGGDTGGVRQQLTASALLRVVADVLPAQEAAEQWTPDTPLEINMFGRRTAVSGRMNTIDQAVDAANLAETYAAKDQPPLNNTTLSGSNQINIRVRFAEASRSDLKRFGIDWNVVGGGGSFSFGLEKSGATQDPNLGVSVGAGDFNIELLIEALQANGTLNILAEPNLTAVTGETASFLAGGEVPIPVPTGQGGESITVQYKPFGVSLHFTPTMVRGNRIALKVKPEVSSIASYNNFQVQGFNLPSFTVRRAETTVEMASGQTFAMAGLFQREVSRNVDKLPILGDVPVLGPLFRSERYQRNETELVILITPYLVEPVSDRSLATPLDRAAPPSWEADIVGSNASLKDAQDHQSGFILK